MSDNDLLQEFYEERIVKGDLSHLPFEELPEDCIKSLSQTLIFAGFKLGRAVDELGRSVRKSFGFND